MTFKRAARPSRPASREPAPTEGETRLAHLPLRQEVYSEMSKENDETDAGLQPDLQPAAPTAPNGPPDGPEVRPEPTAPRPLPAGPDAPTAPPSPPTLPTAASAALPAALQAHLTGEPGSLPATWCKKCQAEVRPQGKGTCPRCHTFLKLNFVSRRHPVNKLRRDQLFDEIVAEYRPQTLELRDACSYLASVKERLESTKGGTPEHQRLMSTWSELSAQLRTASAASQPDNDYSETTPDEFVQRLAEMLTHAVALRDAKREAERPRPEVVVAPGAQPEPSVEAVTPAAPDPCAYCYAASAAACADLKTTRPEVWELLHANDPAEIGRREAEAREQLLDEADGYEFMATGRVTEHMRERQAARPQPTEEQKRQADLRKSLGWDLGVMSETKGWRYRE